MYRALTSSDLPQARALWEASFDDPASFVNWYFEHRFVPHHARGLFDGDQLLAMGQLVPYDFAWYGSMQPLTYLVGLCTQETARGKGLATDLLRSMLEELVQAGQIFTVLMPALPLFYQARGWSYIFHHRHDTLNPSATDSFPGYLAPGSDHDLNTLSVLYDTTFAPTNAFLIRSPKDWQDLLYDHAMDGGELWVYYLDPGECKGYLLVRRLPKKLLIREMAYTDPSYAENAIYLLYEKYPQVPIQWQAWPGQKKLSPTAGSELFPFAMARIVFFQHLIAMFPFHPSVELTFNFKLFDPLIAANNGDFSLSIKAGRGVLKPAKSSSCEIVTTINQWVKWLFGDAHDAPTVLREAIPPASPYLNDLF